MPCSGDYGYEGDYEPADAWKEGSRTARKEYRCYECGAVICPGEQHDYANSLYRGRGWRTMRRCTSCAVLADLVMTVNGGRCPLWGELFSEASDAGIDTRAWRASNADFSPARPVVPLMESGDINGVWAGWGMEGGEGR